MTPMELRSNFDQKVRRGIFSPVARDIANLADAEDRLQEAVCMTYEMAARYAERGQVLNDAILAHSCRLRAVDLGRRFVRDDDEPARDVLHPMNCAKGNVEVYRLDGMLDDDGDIVTAIDLEAWIASLPEGDRERLAMRQAGWTLGSIAVHLDLSISQVFSQPKALGLLLADRAGLPVAGTAPSAAWMRLGMESGIASHPLLMAP